MGVFEREEASIDEERWIETETSRLCADSRIHGRGVRRRERERTISDDLVFSTHRDTPNVRLPEDSTPIALTWTKLLFDAVEEAERSRRRETDPSRTVPENVHDENRVGEDREDISNDHPPVESTPIVLTWLRSTVGRDDGERIERERES